MVGDTALEGIHRLVDRGSEEGMDQLRLVGGSQASGMLLRPGVGNRPHTAVGFGLERVDH